LYNSYGGEYILSRNLMNLSHISVKLDAVECHMKLLQYYKI